MFKNFNFILFLTFIFSFQSQAEFVFSGEGFISDQEMTLADSSINANNRTLQNPTRLSQIDIRTELKYLTEQSKWIARPRWTETYQNIVYTDNNSEFNQALGKIDLMDAYAEWNTSSSLQLTAGLMVDGWGPAEFVNPSNPFFHMNTQSKNFFFKEKGKVLAKLNWNPTGRTTFSVVAEPISNQESSWRYGTDFSPSAMVRVESQSEDSSVIIGLIAGSDSFKSNFFGEYFTLSSQGTGLSAYFEGRHTQNASRFTPTSKSGFISMDLTENKNWTTYSVFGVRYEGRVDTRLEWINYELGYTESEWRQLIQSVTQVSAYLVENLKKFKDPGVEFLTKNWISFSIRVPDLGPKKNWTWTTRALASMGDGAYRASLLQTDLDVPTSFFSQEAWTYYFEGRWIFGDKDTEMLLASSSNIAIGLRYAW